MERIENASGGTVRQRAKLFSIDKDNAKKLNTIIKNTGLKSKARSKMISFAAVKIVMTCSKLFQLFASADLLIDVQFISTAEKWIAPAFIFSLKPFLFVQAYSYA